ncbi:hypothetical protein OIU34_29995 [Pararhizobium sp. BT-229]|uniref:hypothetical protein n=1 Tax=Pararhizobium sp. BT-229 TaxID=2986923 RepID=UPI0021F772BD|nr:hypothetical protein [Pararhizobium sp. BT-229]MCV9966107.1 hypothetical protein [Pararhizobium sp. BT-229]
MTYRISTNQFMRRYGELINEGVRSGATDGEALAKMFAEYFVGSSPSGIIGAQAGPDLAKILTGGIANYKRMGCTRFVIETLGIDAINDLHDLARVGWKFDYRRPADAKEGTIRFENVYFVSHADARPKIFAWVTPDEQAALTAHGLS